MNRQAALLLTCATGALSTMVAAGYLLLAIFDTPVAAEHWEPFAIAMFVLVTVNFVSYLRLKR